MTSRHRLFVSSIGAASIFVASVAAQGTTPPASALNAAERELERAVRVLTEQAAPDSNRARELERAARQLAQRGGLSPDTEPEIQQLAGQLAAGQGREGGARSGGARGGGARAGSPSLADALTRSNEPVVAGAPFSADVVTTVTQTLGDGTRIDQRVSGKIFRDSTGRVRREQTVLGLDAVDPAERSRTVITMDAVPGDSMPYVLDPVARTARRAPLGAVFYLSAVRWNTGIAETAQGTQKSASARELASAINDLAQSRVLSAQRDALNLAGAPIPPDVQPTEEALSQRQVEGVLASGRRTTTIIPTDRIGNDRPIQIVDEFWYSPQLNVVVLSRFSDPRTGVIEYRLTNISRAEPRAELFTVPSDYTVVDGGRGGGRGQRTGGPAPQ